MAFHNKNKAPWISGNPITWDTSFNDNYGNLARFLVDLVIVDTMSITVKSKAIFKHDDQVIIDRNTGGGFWPFYTSSSNIGVSTSHKFDDTGQMTVTISSLPGVPIVIGGNVLRINQYIT